MQALIEGTAIAAKTIFLVNDVGTTSIADVEEAENGAVISGQKEHVGVLQAEKFNDFQIAFQTIQILTDRLSAAFLMTSSITRDAERVTAKEIALMAAELEDALGGTYTILAQELQLPLVKLYSARVSAKGKIPKLPEKLTKLKITTGLDALGRGHKAQKLDTFIATIAQTLGAEAIPKYINAGDLIKRLGSNQGIDMKGLIKTEEQIEQQEQQEQQMALMQQGLPNAINAISNQAQQNQGQE